MATKRAHRPSIKRLRKLLKLATDSQVVSSRRSECAAQLRASLPALLDDVEACESALRVAKMPSLSVMMAYAKVGLEASSIEADFVALIAAQPRCDASHDTYRKPLACDRIATKIVDRQIHYCDAHARRVMSDGTGKCEELSYAKVVRKLEKKNKVEGR